MTTAALTTWTLAAVASLAWTATVRAWRRLDLSRTYAPWTLNPRRRLRTCRSQPLRSAARSAR